MKKFKILLVAITVTVASIGTITAGFYAAAKSAKVEVHDDVSHYSEYLASADNSSKWHKWGMDESIWPESVTDDMNVIDYKMVYYNPWDAQYAGYLAVEYAPEKYAEETERLKKYASTEYIGNYSVTEEKTYQLLAVNADPSYGFVYALTDGKSRIIYAEQIFCNYFMDLDYKEYIPSEYLLDGFDASLDNPYHKQMEKKDDKKLNKALKELYK